MHTSCDDDVTLLLVFDLDRNIWLLGFYYEVVKYLMLKLLPSIDLGVCSKSMVNTLPLARVSNLLPINILPHRNVQTARHMDITSN